MQKTTRPVALFLSPNLHAVQNPHDLQKVAFALI